MEKYFDYDEEMEEDEYNDDQESCKEEEDKEMYFMGTQSQARKQFGMNNNVFLSRPNFRNT